MLNYLKTMLGLSLMVLIGVWMGCSNDTSPVASYSASKTNTDEAVPDANLRNAIRAALGLGPTAPVRWGDLFELSTKLDAEGLGIVNLKGLEVLVFGLVFMDTLNLADNEIADLSPLGGAQFLKYLNLSTNEITDVAPLRGIGHLKYLNLADNSITDIDSLVYWSKNTLTTLNLADNSITSVSPLARLTKLEYLNASSNSITDISDLAGLTELTTLYLADNSITTLSPLASLTKLKRLAIGGNSFRGDISDLAGLTELEWLMINSAGVTDLSPLEGLTKLKYLDVSSSPGLTYFSPLSCLLPDKGALETLVLRGMPLFRVVDGENVPKQDRPDLLYLASKGVTITF